MLECKCLKSHKIKGMSNLRVLLVDDEEAIRDIISFGISLKNKCDIVHAEDGLAAVEILNKDDNFSLIICDYNMPNMNGGEVYQFLKDKQLDIPYVMCSSDEPSDYPVFDDKLFGSILKPSIMEGVDEIFDRLKNQVDNYVEFKQKFVPIPLNILKRLGSTPVDLYIQINDEKVLKVIRSGEEFSINEYEKFKLKGLDSLFIEQCYGEVFLSLLEENLFKVFSNDNLTDEQKITSVQDVISNVAKSFGFSDQVMSLTNRSIDFTMSVLKKDKDLNNLVSKLLLQSNSFISTNNVICAHVCNAIVSNMAGLKDRKDEVLQKLTLASFLQDISLDPDVIKTYEDFKKHVEEDKSIHRDHLQAFKQHPIKSSEIISSSKTSLPDLDRIIMESHERPDGNGFPRKLSTSRVSPLGAILILANAVSEVIFRNIEIKDEINNELIISSIDFIETEDSNFKNAIEAFKAAELF